MNNSKLLFEEEFTIRASEIDFNKKATLPSICNLLQEIAGNHAHQLQFDITDLHNDDRTWVLHRLLVDMERFPQWREKISISTWPSGGDGLRAHRDFLIHDQNNEIIGRALSYWLILDLTTRRPIRIPEEILSRVPPENEHVLPVSNAAFRQIKEADYSQIFRVRKTDLDLNRHLNNVRYIEWAVSCLPENITPYNIDIKFQGETHLNNEVALYATVEDGVIFFEATRTTNEETIAQARSNMEKPK